MKLIVAIVVLDILINLTSSYEISFFDCTNTTKIQTYKYNDICQQETSRQLKTTTYTILQQKSVQYLEGWSCQIIKTQFVEYCGSFSHNKHAEIPQVEVTQRISKYECLNMAISKQFTMPDNTKQKITIGTENIISLTDLGTININDNKVTCSGQPKKIGNHLVNDILSITQFKVMVTKERYRAKGSLVEVLSNHLVFPKQCATSTQGCETSRGTYVWNHPLLDCNLEKIQTATMEVTANGYLRNKDLKILLKKGPATPAPEKCPPTTLYKTEYKDIYLTSPELQNDWPQMTNDLNLEEFITARDDYVMFETEEKLAKMIKENGRSNCLQTLTNKRMIKLTDEPEVFFRRNGDTILRITCKEKKGKIAENPTTCYEDIPLQQGGFVKTDNRLYTSDSPIIPCNKRFALQVNTFQGWIEFLPGVRKIPEPKEL